MRREEKVADGGPPLVLFRFRCNIRSVTSRTPPSLALRLAFVGATLLATAALSEGVAEAYCRTTTVLPPSSYDPRKSCWTDGKALFWKNRCLGFSVNQAASKQVGYDDAVDLVTKGFAAWSSADCDGAGAHPSLEARNNGPVTCDVVEYSKNGARNQNAIIFRESGWTAKDAYNTLGLTTVTFNVDTGEIYGFDMEINAADHKLGWGATIAKDAYDLEGIFVHECGHAIGFAHDATSSSTMYPVQKPGDLALRSLDATDAKGMCEVYRPDGAHVLDANTVEQAPACDPTPRGGFITTCGDKAPSDSGGCSTGGAGGLSTGATVAVATLISSVISRRRRRVGGSRAGSA